MTIPIRTAAPATLIRLAAVPIPAAAPASTIRRHPVGPGLGGFRSPFGSSLGEAGTLVSATVVPFATSILVFPT